MRLTLLPNLRRLWRDSRTVQLGTDPARALVVEFGDPGAVRVLDLLDGTRSRDGVIAEAASRLAVTAADTAAVLDALLAAGLVLDAGDLLPAGLPDATRRRLTAEAVALARYPGTPAAPPAEALRRRAAARVTVSGLETLVAPIALTLAGAGVGHIDPAVDRLGCPEELVAQIGQVAAGTRVAPVRAGAATLAVRVGPRPPSTANGRGRRTAVLTVDIRDAVVLVGPLVGPDGSPCGHCLDLHRRDRDPRWPVLAAQLATTPDGTEHCALTTAVAGAAYAAEEVLSYLDGRSHRTEGAVVEISRPGEARRRSWAAHPRCGCRRRGADPATATPRPAISAHSPPLG
jgi:bacteriocin biosynthesis cyclodehydratase domain-containing protein